METSSANKPEQHTYQCAMCGGEFVSGWTDEEAKAELAENFPGFQPADCAQVCDDCYQQIVGADDNDEERRRLENEEMDKHFRKHPHG